jgi:spermidine synthase
MTKKPERLMKKDLINASLAVFVASFCMLVIEIVAGRILAPHVGVSLYTWTSIIGVVLAGVSMGAYLGGRLADRVPRFTTLGWLFFLSGLSALSISPLVNLFGEFSFGSSLMVRILVITAMIFFVPSCLLGMVSPVVVKLMLKRLESAGSVVGQVYAFSTLGSILGTFLTGFFLISWLGTRPLLAAVSVILLLSALLFGGGFMKRRSFVLLVLLLALFSWRFYEHGFRPPLDEQTYFFTESNYYTIQLKKSPGDPKNSMVTLYLDNLTHSCSDLNDPRHLEFRYIQSYEELLRWQARKRDSFRILFIGGGGYTFPRYVEATYPGAEIDVVEIDPVVTAVSKKYLGVSDASRIRSFNQDARWFVMKDGGREKYDFIFEDAFNDLSIPYHLATREFSADLKQLLKKDGLLLTNVIDRFDRTSFLPSYLRTLEQVFGKENVHLITLSPYAGYSGVINRVVVASPQRLDMEEFARSVKDGDRDGISLVMPRAQLKKSLEDFSPVLLTDDYAPVDNMTAPNFEALYGSRR